LQSTLSIKYISGQGQGNEESGGEERGKRKAAEIESMIALMIII
jgi:hypothetical protein